VGDWLCRMFGRHSLSLSTADQLLGKFNSHLAEISFLLVNEPAFAGDREAQRKLKSMITDAWWLIEGKYRTAYRVPNIAHIIFTTNERQAVPAGNNARRFLVLDVDDCRAGDTAYFNALHYQADHGGVEGLLQLLLGLDIRQFNPAKVPVTAALRVQQELSASAETQWALDAVEDPEAARVVFGASNPFSGLYASLQLHTKEHRGWPITAKMFGAWLNKLGIVASVAAPTAGQPRSRCRTLPDAATFAELVRREAGIHA
jgi:hypothetical protein